MFCSPCSSCPSQKFGIWFGMISQIIVTGVAFWKVATPKYTCLKDMLLLEWFFLGIIKSRCFLFQVFQVNSHWLHVYATHQPYFDKVGFSRSTYNLRSNYDPPKVAGYLVALFLFRSQTWYFKIFNWEGSRVPLIFDFLVIQSDPLITQIEVTFDHLKGSLKLPPKGSLGKTWLKIWKCISHTPSIYLPRKLQHGNQGESYSALKMK